MMLPVTICVLLLSGCFNSDVVTPDPPPTPDPAPLPKPPPAPDTDPEPEPDPISPHAAQCAHYCEVICKIEDGQCPACLPSPGGITCPQRCERQLDTGLIPLDTACREKQSSCAALQFCEE